MKPLRPGTTPPWVVAHRGASSSHPENTRAAFDEALAQGCDGIELDVQLSRDRVPLVYHDRTLRKVGGGRKHVSQVAAAELRKLDMRILTLRDVLRRYGARTRLLIELKARERDIADGWHRVLAESVAAIIRSMRLERQVMILSFDPETLEAVSRRATRLRTVLNLKAPRRMTASLRGRLDSLFALSVDVRTISRSIVGSAHEAGKPVMVFTCNTPRTANRALDAAVDVIMSDRPAWLRRFVEDRLAKRAGGSSMES